MPKPWASYPRLALVLLITAIGISAAFVFPLREWIEVVLQWIRERGSLGPVLLIAIYVPAAVLLIPGSWLTLGAGFIFGPWLGTAVASAGSVLGACAAFALGRTVARSLVERQIMRRPTFKALDAAVGQEGFKIVFLTRLSPMLPFGVLNYLFSISQVKFRAFFIATWVGMLPASCMYAYFGSAAQSILGVYEEDQSTNSTKRIFFVIGLVATVVVTVVVTRVARRALREAVPETAEPSL